MRLKSVCLHSTSSLLPEHDTSDMLPHKCPECGRAEEEGAAGVPLLFQMRIHRTARVIAVSLVLLLGVSLASLVMLMFGSPALLSQRKPETVNVSAAPEAVSEKQHSKMDLFRQSVQLTINKEPHFEWQYESGNTHRRGNMTFERDHLHVLSKGLYRLYLQITFIFESDKCFNKLEMCPNDLLSLKINVDAISSNYLDYRPLLVSEDTMTCTEDWTRTLFTAGNFELEAHTKLRVQIRHKDLVNTQDTHSFFGAEMISAL